MAGTHKTSRSGGSGRWIAIGLLAASALGAATAAGSRPPDGDRLSKPDPPIDLEAGFSGAGPFVITARASSRLDAEIEVDLLLPDGATIPPGGRASKGRRPELRVETSSVPPGTCVRATLRHGSARLTRIVPLSPALPPAGRGGVLKRNSRGEPLREFGP